MRSERYRGKQRKLDAAGEDNRALLRRVATPTLLRLHYAMPGTEVRSRATRYRRRPSFYGTAIGHRATRCPVLA
eukprot:953491-Rhodomonas_salina.1